MGIGSEQVPYYEDLGTIAPLSYLHRLDPNSKGQRWYYKVDDDTAEVSFFPSVTTVISGTTPTPEAIKEHFIAKHGKDYKDVLSESADYGTFEHMMVQQLAKFGHNHWPSHSIKYYNQMGRDEAIPKTWKKRCQKAMLSFAQWMNDYKVKILAIEMPVYYRGLQGGIEDPEVFFGGCIDFVVEMTMKIKGDWGEVYKSGNKKGQPKLTFKECQVIAIIDYKSRIKNGYFRGHIKQLNMYKMAWNEMFPTMPIDHIFNLSPSDWQASSQPKFAYEFTSQIEKRDGADKITKDEILYSARLFHSHNEPKKTDTYIHDEISLTNHADAWEFQDTVQLLKTRTRI